MTGITLAISFALGLNLAPPEGAPPEAKPVRIYNITGALPGCEVPGACIVRDAELVQGSMRLLLSIGNGPTRQFRICIFTLSGELRSTTNLPAGFAYISFKSSGQTFFVSRITGRKAEIIQIAASGTILSIIPTPAIATQIITGSTPEDTVWISHGAAKLTTTTSRERLPLPPLLSMWTLMLPAGDQRALLIDQPTGTLSFVSMLDATWRRQPLPRSPSIDRLIRTNAARKTQLLGEVLGKAARGAVFLAVSACRDLDGSFLLLLGPVSKTKGALVVLLSGNGAIQREMLCKAPRDNNSTGFTPRFILRDSNGIVLISTQGLAVKYQI